ncbi:MAG: preprotein translocase subunit SecG [Marinilabiliales bacterium]|nr:MAG: preprotein translocase subunit SecG [Marinilabiliales bacterium]
MYTFFSIMIIICAVLLILIVLVQNSKGGGLSSSFGQGNQVMGVKKTADFLEKATWTLAIGLVVFCLLASFSIPNRKVEEPTQTEQPTPNTPTTPAAPAE